MGRVDDAAFKGEAIRALDRVGERARLRQESKTRRQSGLLGGRRLRSIEVGEDVPGTRGLRAPLITEARDPDSAFAEATDEPDERALGLLGGALSLPEQVGLTGPLRGDSEGLEDQGHDGTTLPVEGHRLSEAESKELHEQGRIRDRSRWADDHAVWIAPSVLKGHLEVGDRASALRVCLHQPLQGGAQHE